jgi:hypothetical protein
MLRLSLCNQSISNFGECLELISKHREEKLYLNSSWYLCTVREYLGATVIEEIM